MRNHNLGLSLENSTSKGHGKGYAIETEFDGCNWGLVAKHYLQQDVNQWDREEEGRQTNTSEERKGKPHQPLKNHELGNIVCFCCICIGLGILYLLVYLNNAFSHHEAFHE